MDKLNLDGDGVPVEDYDHAAFADCSECNYSDIGFECVLVSDSCEYT